MSESQDKWGLRVNLAKADTRSLENISPETAHLILPNISTKITGWIDSSDRPEGD